MKAFFHSLLLILALLPVLQAADPDLAAPAFQDLRKAWLQEKASLDSARTRAYRDLLEARLQEAELDYQEKTVNRNVKGMSVSRKAKSITEDALASVTSNGTFTLPATVRRELEDWLKKITDDRAAADKQADESLATLRVRYLSRFGEAVAAQTGAKPAEADLNALFDRLLTTEAPRPPPPPSAAAATNAAAAGAAESPWFASNGEAANWFTIGRLTADVMAQDVFSVPLLNVTNSYTAAKSHPLNGQSSPVSYTLVRPLSLAEGTRCAFRLKRMAGRKPVTVLGWPSAANRGRLEFRPPAFDLIPSLHGFEIEAALTNTVAAPVVPTVEVRVETVPAGAEIRINDKLLVTDAGWPLLTPATLRAPAVPSTLKLSLKDHLAKVIDKWTPQQGQRLTWKFQPEWTLPPAKSIRLDPTKPWTAPEVSVRAGDRVWIVPSGQWTIGGRGELCGPDGYPQVPKFDHYYAAADDPRQQGKAPYGALLAKLAYDAEPVACLTNTCLQAPAAGKIFLDVNEKTGKEFRKDNRGVMSVNIVVIPLAAP